MSASGGDPDDPFRTDAPPVHMVEPGAGPPAPPSDRSPDPSPDHVEPTPQARALGLRLAIVSVAAVASAFVAPPLGAVLGVMAIVLALRSKGRVLPRVRAIALVAGSIAVVVGVAISVVGWLCRTEITDYSRCLQGANTRQAEQNCQDALNDALSSRLGL